MDSPSILLSSSSVLYSPDLLISCVYGFFVFDYLSLKLLYMVIYSIKHDISDTKSCYHQGRNDSAALKMEKTCFVTDVHQDVRTFSLVLTSSMEKMERVSFILKKNI